jgi:hypothetical protein
MTGNGPSTFYSQQLLHKSQISDLRTNSDNLSTQQQLAGFCNPDGVCLLRSTDWVFVI